MVFKKLTLIVPAVLALSACTTSGDPCAGFKIIRPAQSDIAVISSDLVDQILVHNETGEKLCKWKP